MTDELALGFPVINHDGGHFLEDVSYKVEATQGSNHRKLYITHTLTGGSFIAELINKKKAKFSVSLFYKDSAERENFVCDEQHDHDEEENKITVEQTISITFTYAPEITANIILLNNETIIVDSKSGLTDFWQEGKFDIPAFSRIAYHQKLKFAGGDVCSLIKVKCDETFQNGTIKTIVTETTGEGEQPIKITCALDVFKELQKGVVENPKEPKAVIRVAIVTQVLCHVYGYMNNLADKETDIHEGLRLHMEMVKDKTTEDWEGSDFNASFAATKMLPYAIKALYNED